MYQYFQGGLELQRINRKTLNELYKELKKTNFWCLNTEDEEEIYNYLKDGLGVRFAKSKETIPNMEVKFALKPLQKESFNDRILIVMGKEELKISSLETVLLMMLSFSGKNAAALCSNFPERAK